VGVMVTRDTYHKYMCVYELSASFGSEYPQKRVTAGALFVMQFGMMFLFCLLQNYIFFAGAASGRGVWVQHLFCLRNDNM
jgi:hypothetical protein